MVTSGFIQIIFYNDRISIVFTLFFFLLLFMTQLNTAAGEIATTVELSAGLITLNQSYIRQCRICFLSS